MHWEAIMRSNVFVISLWLVCGAVTVLAAVLAGRHSQARYLGRAAVGVLFTAGGAVVHVVNLATGDNHAGFADPAHFWWAAHAWNAMVVPNHTLLISLLAVFEAAAGVLVLTGGRRTHAGYLATGRRAFFRAMGGRYGDHRNWAAIETWADHIAAQLLPSADAQDLKLLGR